MDDPNQIKCQAFSVNSGEGNGTPLQYSCLENPTDGGAWYAAVHGVTKSRTRLSDLAAAAAAVMAATVDHDVS